MSDETARQILTALDVSDTMVFRGHALRGAVVRDGGSLTIHGLVEGDIRVESGGRCWLSGLCRGSAMVKSGGFLEITGALDGTVLESAGEVLVTAGSRLSGDVVTPTGGLQRPASGSYMIDESTPRFRVTVLGSTLSLRPA